MERLNLLRRALLRPELTAVAGTVLVFAYFAVTVGGNGFLSYVGTRNYLEVAAEIGILATAVTLLLVAGEFDLSVGAQIGSAGIAFAYAAVYLGWPLWASLVVGLAFASIVGGTNGVLTVWLRIPSFLVTLAMMFVLKGVGLALTVSLTNATQIFQVREALRGDPLLAFFAGSTYGVPVSLLWWLGVTVLATYVLTSTRFGNWIFASGGDPEAALKMGIPVARVKVILFIATAMSATLVSILAMFVVNTADVQQGFGKEFEAATAAVIGGAAITGGYGSPLGTAFGALMFAMVSQGFFYTSINDNWFYAFMGGMLLLAVIVNGYTRRVSSRRATRK